MCGGGGEGRVIRMWAENPDGFKVAILNKRLLFLIGTNKRKGALLSIPVTRMTGICVWLSKRRVSSFQR